MSRVPTVLAVSDRGRLERPEQPKDTELGRWCTALAEAGVDALQVREKSLADRPLLELVRHARESFPAPRLLLVNGRFDVALAAGADGVQLPAAGLPATAVRSTLGARPVIGVSTHTPGEVEQAAADGAADFVLFGPVFPTPAKLGVLDARGLDALRAVCARGLPVIAVGGIDAGNAGAAIAAGASGVAAIRACADAGGARELVAAVREARPA